MFRFLVVFNLRFVETGTPTPLSFPNIRSDTAKLDGCLFKIFVEQFGNRSNTSKWQKSLETFNRGSLKAVKQLFLALE